MTKDTLNLNNLSLSQALTIISRHKLYDIKMHYLVVYQDPKLNEWIPYGLYDSYAIAEHFERLVKHDFRSTSILPIEHYILPVKA
jgi:hypothetical protein